MKNIRGTKTIVLILTLSLVRLILLPSVAQAFDGWRVMPIRSEEEFNLGMIGGEAEQHMHGVARSVSNPDIIYMSHDIGQIWKSTDAGETWKRPRCINLSLVAGESVEVDPVDPDIVFLIVSPAWNWLAKEYGGLYRSKDGGDTWEFILPMDIGVKQVRYIYQHTIAYDPASVTDGRAMIWYAATPIPTSEGGLFRSDDGGQSWTESLGLKDEGISTIYDIKCHPTDGKTVYAGTDRGLYYSNEKGENIRPYGNLPSGPVSSIAINPQEPNIIYATISGEGLYRSLDGGNNFSLLRSFDASGIFINPGYPDVIYLSGLSSNTITSHDGGITWITDMRTAYRAPRFGLETRPWRAKIAGSKTGIVPNPEDRNEAVAFSRGTFWKTTDGGHTFIDSSTLFTGYHWGFWNNAIDFAQDKPDRFATFNGDVAVYVTDNNSDYFNRRNDGIWNWYNSGLIAWIGSYSGAFHPTNSDIIVAAVGNGIRTQLMRTTNAGQNWTLVTSGDENVETHFFIGFNTNNPNIVYAGDKISYDTGQTFSHVDFGDFNTYNPYIIGMCLSNPDTIYALDQELYRIFRSDDRGANWYLYSQPGWRFRRLDGKPTFAVDPVDANKVYTLYNYDLGVYDGNTWRKFGVLDLAGGSELKNFVRTVAIDPNHPEIIYAGMCAAGIPCAWRSVDGGYTWEDITYNLPRGGLAAIAVNPHTGEVLIGSGCGTKVLPPPYESENLIYDKCISTMPSVLYGDVSGNGRITAYDAALVAQYAVGLIVLTPEQIQAADVSGNGEVTAYDASLIAQYVVGLIDSFIK